MAVSYGNTGSYGSGVISVSVKITKDNFNQMIDDVKIAAAEAALNTVTAVRDYVYPYTPMAIRHTSDGARLNCPEIHTYGEIGNGFTVSLQWRAHRGAYYYADIQNSNYSYNHTVGGPGFIDIAVSQLEQVNEQIKKSFSQRGY